MAAPRDAFECVAHDVVVEHPPIAPYFYVGSGDNLGGVGRITWFFDVDDAIVGNTHLTRSVVLAKLVDKIILDGNEVWVLWYFDGDGIFECLCHFLFATGHTYAEENDDGKGI
jgi:hypothetical protein